MPTLWFQFLRADVSLLKGFETLRWRWNLPGASPQKSSRALMQSTNGGASPTQSWHISDGLWACPTRTEEKDKPGSANPQLHDSKQYQINLELDGFQFADKCHWKAIATPPQYSLYLPFESFFLKEAFSSVYPWKHKILSLKSSNIQKIFHIYYLNGSDTNIMK